MSDPLAGKHGTTILAFRWANGVAVAGDRRASAGQSVFYRSSEKLVRVSGHSVVALSGSVGGHLLDIAHRFQMEVERYEKVNNRPLTLDGQANLLARMVRDNLAAATIGLVFIPLFAGFDIRWGVGRIFDYDVTGGCWSDEPFATAGSGAPFARAVLSAAHSVNLPRTEAVRLALAAIEEAADLDTATGGVDAMRGIYPRVLLATAEGIEQVPDRELAELFADRLQQLGK
jgi:proteasome beta subunit